MAFSMGLKCGCLCLYLVVLFSFTMAQVVEAEDHETQCPVFSVEKNEHCFTSDVDKSCQRGYYRKEPCGDFTNCCDFCEENTFQPKFNNCKCCILCTNCTELGREELQACNITDDAKCGNRSASVAPVEEAEGVTTEATVISETTTACTGSGKEDASDLPPQSTWPEICLGVFYFVLLLVAFAATLIAVSLLWIWNIEFTQICHKKIKNFWNAFVDHCRGLIRYGVTSQTETE